MGAAIAAAVIGAIGSGLSAAAASGGGGGGGVKPFKKSTTSGNAINEQTFQFDKVFEEAMHNMATTLNQWGQEDRNFFKQEYLPFQQQLINTNSNLLPVIAQNSGESLRQSLKDLISNEPLKRAFRESAILEGGQKAGLENQFVQEIQNLPTEQDAVNNALVSVEAKFGQAGAELKRKLAGSGRGITQSSLRDLEIQKAAAKAGAAESAANQNRQLRLTALSQGIGMLGTQQGLNTTQLLQARGMDQQAGNLLPQVGGLKQFDSASSAAKLSSGLVEKGAEKILGTNTQNRQAQWFQKGLKNPIFFDPKTNKAFSEPQQVVVKYVGNNNTGIGNVTDYGPSAGAGGVGNIGFNGDAGVPGGANFGGWGGFDFGGDSDGHGGDFGGGFGAAGIGNL